MISYCPFKKKIIPVLCLSKCIEGLKTGGKKKTKKHMPTLYELISKQGPGKPP